MNSFEEQELLNALHEGFRRVGLTFPYLIGLIGKLRVQLDRRVPTTGIFASGRVVANPDFVRALSPNDLMFVLAHELYHLTLRTHDRAEGTNPSDFNVAHDFIINDILREELQVAAIPAGGLDWPGARLLSAERILNQIDRHPQMHQGLRQGWGMALSEEAGSAADGGPQGDVLGPVLEKEWFPKDSAGEARAREIRKEAAKALSLQALMDAMRGRGATPAGRADALEALRGLYRPCWEMALQRWLESVAPGERTFSRPSRRGADRCDVILPGRKRESWTLHIVLDTSGSMTDELPRALGAIADFCSAVGVDQVHLIQCDTEVGRDEVLAPAEVSRWQVTGYGGSDLTPAMTRLAEDRQVTAAIVLTDGDTSYPESPVPYTVLWVLPPWKSPQQFTPGYGKVITMGGPVSSV